MQHAVQRTASLSPRSGSVAVADYEALGISRFETLEEQLRFEQFLADFAVRFQNLPSERIDDEIVRSLEGLVRGLGVERAGLALFSKDHRSLLTAHDYAVPPAPQAVQQDFAITLPWMTSELRAGRTVVLQRLPDDLPPQAQTERHFVAASGMLSAIVVPLGAGDDLLGGLAVSTFSVARGWPRRLVARVELLASVLANAMHRRASALKIQELTERLTAENVYLQRAARRGDGFDEIVGSSAGIASVLRQIEQVASTEAPVLILGETGTGKELVARALHNRSNRASRPFVAINCAALPPALIESELFGHEKGAFTGAVSRMIGRFEIAAGGTLFLDEIGDLPPELQVKLLRVLQTGSFERLGSARSLYADVRVIAATHRDLTRAVHEGRFREDLYYRIGVFPIRVPPLRERLDDIPLLVWHTITRRQRDLRKTIERVPDTMLRAFSNYDWPGNVRELQNVIERAMIVTTGPTLAWNASFLAGLRVARSCSGETLAAIERAHIVAVLEECGYKIAGRGNTAERLGLKRSTLQARMKKLGIERPRC